MTGGGRTQQPERPWRLQDHVKVITRDEFSDLIENGKIKKTEIADLYNEYYSIIKETALKNVEIAKDVQKNIKSFIQSARGYKEALAYLYMMHNHADNENKVRIFAKHYNKLINYAQREKNIIMTFLDNQLFSKQDAKSLEEHIGFDPGQAFPKPQAEIVLSMIGEKSFGKMVFAPSFNEYLLIKKTIDALLKNSEPESTIEKYLLLRWKEWDGDNCWGFVSDEKHNLKINLNNLVQARSGISLSQITGELSYFAKALTGLPVDVACVNYGDSCSFDGQRIQLPITEVTRGMHETRSYYRAATAHQAGQIEFGTFDLDLNKVKHLRGLVQKHEKQP